MSATEAYQKMANANNKVFEMEEESKIASPQSNVGGGRLTRLTIIESKMKKPILNKLTDLLRNLYTNTS